MSLPSLPPAVGGWAVTAQQESTELASNGQFVKGMSVFFQTGSGVAGSVFVPDMLYTPDYVRDAINAKAQQLDIIAGLSG
jgi:hypothetical protein